MYGDAWRLAVGTLTAVPVPSPSRVDLGTTRWAMVLAPVAVLPLGVAVAIVLAGGAALGLAPLAVAVAAVGVLALGSRAFHLDGLADTADGLTASYDRARSLEVMKTGPVGPAGVVALVVVLGVQAGSLVSVPPVLAGVLVCVSRVALVACCCAGVPSAAVGLGSSYAGTVPRLAAVVSVVVSLVLVGFLGFYVGLPWWRGPLAVVLAGVAVALVLLRAVRRLGGVTGDVFGACIEVALAVLLVAVT